METFDQFTDEEMLARIIQAEAAREPFRGKLAVGAVIANRVQSGRYGDGVRGVITKPGQFSAINDVTGYAGGQGANRLFWKKPGPESRRAARAIMSGRYRDPTGGATHYYNPEHAAPSWARGKRFDRIGNHVFGNADAGSDTLEGGERGDVMFDPDKLKAAHKALKSEPANPREADNEAGRSGYFARRFAQEQGNGLSGVPKQALLEEAVRRGLVSREQLEAEARRRGLDPSQQSARRQEVQGEIQRRKRIEEVSTEIANRKAQEQTRVDVEHALGQLDGYDALRDKVRQRYGGGSDDMEGLRQRVREKYADESGEGSGYFKRRYAKQQEPGQAQEPEEPGFVERAAEGFRGMFNEFTAGLQSVDPNTLNLPEGVTGQGFVGVMDDEGVWIQSDSAPFGAVGERVPFDQFPRDQFFTRVNRDGQTEVYQRTPETASNSAVLDAGRVLTMGAVAPGLSGTMTRAGRAAKPLPEAQQAAQAAQRAGVTPSFMAQGNASIGAAMDASAVTRGRVQRDIARATNEMAGARERIAATAGQGTGPINAGDALRSGAENFIARNLKGDAGGPSISAKLLANVERRIPVTTQIDMSNAARTLQGILDEFPNLPSAAKDLGVSKWQGWIDDIQANGGRLQWNEARALRTLIGENIGRINSVLGDRSTGQVKQLYGALSDDLRAAAEAAGPEAAAAWTRYNKHYRRSSQMVDEALDIIMKTDHPEAVFNKFYALAADKGGRANLRKLVEIKKAIPDEEWGQVISTVVRRMGQKGDDFSPAAFVTEWDKLSPQAKNVLFGGRKVPTGLKSALDDLVTVASRSKGAEKLINNSRSGAVLSDLALGTGVATTIASGNVVAIALTGLGLAGARGSATLMTNPAFLRGLRQYIASGGSRGRAQALLRLIKDNPNLAAMAVQAREASRPPEAVGQQQGRPSALR